MQRGFGSGIAPWVVGVNFLVISGGKRYEGRAATPIPQLAADVTVEAGRALRAYLDRLPIDPTFDARCMLLDDNGDPMVKEPMGTRTADGKFCMVQGEKFAIGENFWRDKKKSVVCRDEKLTDCLLYRRRDAHGFRVLHRPWVGEDCVLRENVYDTASPATGQLPRAVQLAVLGAQTPDKTGCRDAQGRVHAVGKQYYREEEHLWVCDAPRIEEQRDRCFLALAELPQNMQNQVTPTGRIARALDQGMSRKAESIARMPDHVVKTAEDVADGRITFTTIKGGLLAKARSIAAHATIDAGKQYLKDKVTEIKEWGHKSGIEQGEDAARTIGDAMVPDPLTVATVLPGGGVGGGMLRVGEELEEAAKLGKQVHGATKLAAEKKAATVVNEANKVLTAKGTLGKAISEGHAFEKHVVQQGEFQHLGILTPEDFAKHIDHVVSHAQGSNVRVLSGGRKAYWDELTGTVVIHNPNASDMGTAFRPKAGRKYFEELN